MTKGHGNNFEQKKEALISALLAGKSQAEAAQLLDLNRATVNRWMQLPEFQNDFLQARRNAMTQANVRIQNNAAALVSVALKLVSQEGTPASVKAHLVLGLLDRGNQSVDRDDILVRLVWLKRIG